MILSFPCPLLWISHYFGLIFLMAVTCNHLFFYWLLNLTLEFSSLIYMGTIFRHPTLALKIVAFQILHSLSYYILYFLLIYTIQSNLYHTNRFLLVICSNYLIHNTVSSYWDCFMHAIHLSCYQKFMKNRLNLVLFFNLFLVLIVFDIDSESL